MNLSGIEDRGSGIHPHSDCYATGGPFLGELLCKTYFNNSVANFLICRCGSISILLDSGTAFERKVNEVNACQTNLLKKRHITLDMRM